MPSSAMAVKIRVNKSRVVLLDDLALVHEDHAVGHGFGKAHFVRHAEYCDAFIGYGCQNPG